MTQMPFTMLEIPFLEFEGTSALRVENERKMCVNNNLICTSAKKVVPLQANSSKALTSSEARFRAYKMSINKNKIVPFRYPGGKFYALGLIEPYILACKHDEYREPFLGGGSVFFNKDKAQYNILNDIDNELMITYKVMQDPFLRNQLLAKVKNEIASKERWREVFEFVPSNELEIAFKYFYLNRTSFSGKLISPAWGYRDKRSLPPERWNEKIEPSGLKLEGAELYNLDFEEIINKEAKGKNVLMFIDPPYFKPKKKKHYRHGFETEDHIRLAKCLKETKYNFILTYEDVEEVRDLYSWAYINDIEFSYRVDNSAINNGQRKKGAELIITNYRVNNTKQLSI